MGNVRSFRIFLSSRCGLTICPLVAPHFRMGGETWHIRMTRTISAESVPGGDCRVVLPFADHSTTVRHLGSEPRQWCGWIRSMIRQGPTQLGLQPDAVQGSPQLRSDAQRLPVPGPQSTSITTTHFRLPPCLLPVVPPPTGCRDYNHRHGNRVTKDPGTAKEKPPMLRRRLQNRQATWGR